MLFYIVYYNVYRIYFLVKACVYHGSPQSVALSVSYMPIYVPIVMYGLRLFISQEIQCLHCCVDVDIIRVIGTLYLSFHQVLFVYTFQFLR